MRNIEQYVTVDEHEVAEHFDENADFAAAVLNILGKEYGFSDGWLREFAAELDDQGEAALRALVAKLDAIDATSSEGR